MKNQNKAKTSRGETSRKKILKTTRHLIGKSDINSVTLDQIAAECSISKSSILWHFGSKEELFFEVVEMVFRNLEAAYNQKYDMPMTPVEKTMLFLNDYENFIKENPEIPMIFFSFIFNHSMREKMKKRVCETYNWNRQACMDQLGISENMSVILVGMINGIIIQANVDPENVNLRSVFDELILLVRNVVGINSQH